MSSKDLKPSDVTPEAVYRNRRKFLETSIYASTGLATFGAYRFFRGRHTIDPQNATVALKHLNDETSTSIEDITHYNNFYEFSTDKEAVARAAERWNISDWKLEVTGLVENPLTLSLKDIDALGSEERIYRFRCVEGWSMIIPWQGFSLATLLEKAKPAANAAYVAFESYYDEKTMPDA
jgi:methionine sulfoxide reductase catalytic subunit